MFRFTVILIIAGMLSVQTAEAQTLRQRLKQRPNERVSVDDSDDSRNDLEGTVWEYKVIDPKTKKTHLTGKVRIKNTALFAVATKEDADSDKSDTPIKDAIANRIAAKTEADAGGDRIGDIVYDNRKKRKPNEYTFRFDKDDEHELSGVAVVKRDAKKRGGVWLGNYNDAEKKRWRFEMRKIED